MYVLREDSFTLTFSLSVLNNNNNNREVSTLWLATRFYQNISSRTFHSMEMSWLLLQFQKRLSQPPKHILKLKLSGKYKTRLVLVCSNLPEVLIHLHPNSVAHSMLEHVALADHVEEHGEAGHVINRLAHNTRQTSLIDGGELAIINNVLSVTFSYQPQE